ncbi:MAG: relaxase/mobilization nuclease domain-containing protein, partial [Oscillospiraceae bacterium]|nr:relaxase/mobilization nuclease domain-containing protein [Oscillospiraceae bacterium]
MATTKIWSIKGDIGHVIRYAENSAKTDGSRYSSYDLQSLQDVMAYATDPTKTEHRLFVTGINVTPNNARDKMMQTKMQYGKSDGIVAFHGYQSFAPGEITPEMAREIGIKLAEELWGGRFEVIVATHLDKSHIHNHFVLNSVSFVDGKKFYDNKATYAKMRQVSDRLCKEYGLSVIKNPKSKAMNYAEWSAQKQGKPTIRSQMKDELDEIIRCSITFNEFWRQLNRRGYVVHRRGYKIAHASIIPPYAKRPIRLDSLGENYTEEAILQRIIAQRNGIRQFTTPTPPKRYKLKSFKPKKLKGFIALYFHYLYLFKRIQRKQVPQRVSFYMRDEMIRLERYQKQFKFLYSNGIEKMSQL